ncbi:class I SAM-dependent methyltransferase [Falsiroseomonas sp. E2-1-a20]
MDLFRRLRGRARRIASLRQDVATLRAELDGLRAETERRAQALEARMEQDLLPRAVHAVAEGMVRRTLTRGTPNLDPAHLAIREIPNLISNVKVLGTEQAERLWQAAPMRDLPGTPTRTGLGGRLCRQADIESPWLRYWLGQAQIQPMYHRKVWETGFVLQALWEGGAMREGVEALGFAVGQEPIPAVLASRGMRVLATDLSSQDPRAQVWRETQQNAAELAPLRRPGIIPDALFHERCAFREVDMTSIPTDFAGRFDVVWSTCSLEHLGSIEAGLRFIEQAMACLRPGGIAVHTTEYNAGSNDVTLDNWPTVLFRQRDIEEVARRLEAAGHEVLPLDFSPGTGILDGYVDLPPYGLAEVFPRATSLPPHLRLSIDGFVATSIGLIIRAGR